MWRVDRACDKEWGPEVKPAATGTVLIIKFVMLSAGAK
jgi:hypothetical protein